MIIIRRGIIPPASTADITTGLVLKLGCHDGSGTVITDQSGFGRDFTADGATPDWDSTTGFKAHQDGTSYGRKTHASWMDFTTQMTFFGWAKAYNGAPSTGYLLANYDSGGQAAFLPSIDGGSGDKLRVLLTNDGSTARTITSTSQAAYSGAYHSVGFTFNSGTVKLYIDGNPDTIASDTGATVNSLAVTTGFMSIGAIALSGSAVYVDVAVRNLYLFNVAKTDADIAALHALG